MLNKQLLAGVVIGVALAVCAGTVLTLSYAQDVIGLLHITIVTPNGSVVGMTCVGNNSTIVINSGGSTPAYTPTYTPSPTPIVSEPSPTPTPTTPTLSYTPTTQSSPSPSSSPTSLPSSTPTPVPTPTPSSTPTPVPVEPSPSPSPSPSSSPTSLPSSTPTPVPTPTPSPVPTGSLTVYPSGGYYRSPPVIRVYGPQGDIGGCSGTTTYYNLPYGLYRGVAVGTETYNGITYVFSGEGTVYLDSGHAELWVRYTETPIATPTPTPPPIVNGSAQKI